MIFLTRILRSGIIVLILCYNLDVTKLVWLAFDKIYLLMNVIQCMTLTVTTVLVLYDSVLLVMITVVILLNTINC